MEPQQERSRQRRSAIIDATALLLTEDGFASISQRRIATRARIPLSSVSYYFSTMDALFAAVFEREFDARNAEFRHVLETALVTAATRGQALDAAATVLAARSDDRSIMQYELYLAGARSPELRATVRESMEARDEVNRQTMDALGLSRALSPVVIRLLEGYALQRLVVKPDPEQDARDIALALRAIARGSLPDGMTMAEWESTPLGR